MIVTEEYLSSWEDWIDYREAMDVVVDYLDQNSDMDWCSISRTAVIAWNLMFSASVEEDSPMSDFFSAIAAQSSRGAYASVAKALGVDVGNLELAVAAWEEGMRSDSVGFSGLKKLIDDEERKQGISGRRGMPQCSILRRHYINL